MAPPLGRGAGVGSPPFAPVLIVSECDVVVADLDFERDRDWDLDCDADVFVCVSVCDSEASLLLLLGEEAEEPDAGDDAEGDVSASSPELLVPLSEVVPLPPLLLLLLGVVVLSLDFFFFAIFH